MHLISKLRDTRDGGGRIGIILNGSPLFTGGAGSGESEIRRYILEADLLEAIVALPTDMFYNTGIATYVWVLSNKKDRERKGKVQLINGANLCGKVLRPLGSKRNVMGEDDIATITRAFGRFEQVDTLTLDKPDELKSNRGRQADTPKAPEPKTFSSKIFATTDFGYRRITVERPLRLSVQFTNERLAELREKKQLLDAVSWKNPEAQRVIKKVLKEKANQLYGLFMVAGKVVEFQADGDLRDNENIPLDPSRPVTETVEAYFKKEVAPHVPDAWIDAGKRDEKDGELGIVGYEIAFNKLFFSFEKLKNLEDIDLEISSATKELFSHYRGICKYGKNA